MKTPRAIRAIATTLSENLNPSQSTIGIDIKIQAGIVFSTVVQNDQLHTVVTNLAGSKPLTSEQLDLLTQFSSESSQEPPTDSIQSKALLNMAKAASPSPAIITTDIVAECQNAEISSAGIVEMVTWLSVLQMLHRLSSYLQFSGSETIV